MSRVKFRFRNTRVGTGLVRAAAARSKGGITVIPGGGGGGGDAALLLTRYYGCAGTFDRLVNVDNIGSSPGGLQHALNNALPGDRIHLLGAASGGPAGGIYNGLFEANINGTAAKRIVVCGDQSDPVTIQEPSGTPSRCRINSNYTSVYGIKFLGSTANDVIMWCDGAEFVEVIGCELAEGSGNAAIAVDDVQGGLFAYNYIHHTGLSDIQHGFYYRSNGPIGTGAVRSYIVRNHIAFCGGRGISCHDNSGDPQYNLTVSHNTILGCASVGILSELWESVGCIFANNLLSMNDQVASTRQMRFDSGRNVLILNNVRWHTSASKRGISVIPETGYSAADFTESGNVDASDPLVTALSLSGAPGRGSSDSDNPHLQSGSPAIALGLQAYSVSPDFDNQAVTSPYDAGAYEFA